MGILIMFFVALVIFMLAIVFKNAESKSQASVATMVTIVGILGFVLFLETNLDLVCEMLDAASKLIAMTFVTVMEFIVTSLQFAIIAFFEGFIWLFTLIADCFGWVFVNSIWLFGQAPFTCSMSLAMLCVWGGSGS